jgi:hypothetical protein
MMGALATGRLEWGRLISTKNQNMASASFTPSRLTSRLSVTTRRRSRPSSEKRFGARRSGERGSGCGCGGDGRGNQNGEGTPFSGAGSDALARQEHDDDEEEEDEEDDEEEEPLLLLYPAGLHERDMFTSIADGCFDALMAVLGTTKDDFLVLKALQVAAR